MYVKDATNYVAAASYLNLVSHYHEGSIATSFGGSLFLIDYQPASSVRLKLTKGATGTSSFILNKCQGTGCSGGAIAFSVQNQVEVALTDTTFDQNHAGANGGGIFVDNKITSTFLLTSASCTMSSDIAQTSGGFLYVSQTSLSTEIKIAGSTISGHEAQTGSGGVLYVSSTTSNKITFDNSLILGGSTSSVSSSKAALDGGAFYMEGPEQNHLILDAFTTLTSSQAGQNGGVVSMLASLTSASP